MNNTDALDNLLVRELTRTKQSVVTDVQNLPNYRLNTAPTAPPTAAAGATNVTGLFMIGVSAFDGTDVIA